MERHNKTCRDCGKPFSIAQQEMEWLESRGLQPFTRCAECRQRVREERRHREEVFEVRTCRVCGQQFELTNGNMDWFAKHGLSPFTKCHECRKALREQRGQEL